MPTLILVRHGQSVWNLENRFTGETDVELTTLGEQEAKFAGGILSHFAINLVYTSVLRRATHTAEIILKVIGADIPVVKSAALNERNYGDLQGLSKADMVVKYGQAQISLWRRSYNISPPHGESLADTFARVVPYYNIEIEPKLKSAKHILIVAHGNSLRALMMHLESLTPSEIADVNIPTGIPRLYEFNNDMEITKVEYLF